jgi:hypothetical protein
MKLNTTKMPNSTNRANLEEKFDAGQDVSDYFDFSRAVVWGGKRKGAGRKPLGKVRKQVLLSAAIIAKVDAIAKKRKQSFSAVLEDACGSFT